MTVLSLIHTLISRVRGFFSASKLDQELDCEIESHLAMLTEENMRRGMNQAAARLAARREFGNVTEVTENHRQMRSLPRLETFLQDLRYALRMLKKSPVFTAVAVVTLGFGMGLNTTFFSVLNAVALKPIPVRDSGRIVRLERWFKSNARGNVQYQFSYAEFRFFSEHNRVFSSLIATTSPLRVTASLPLDAARSRITEALLGPPERAMLQMVSANYFSVLGADPALGRGFRLDEGNIRNTDPVVILSYPYWQKRFGGDPQIIGKLAKINNTAFTVIGVAPPQFVGTGNPPVTVDLWTLLSMQRQVLPRQDWLDRPLDYQIQLLGYLAPGISRKQAEADLSWLEKSFTQDHPVPRVAALSFLDRLRLTTTAVTVQTAGLFGNTEDIRFKAVVALLMTILAMVLAIACANLANMLLAKASGRQNEIAIRVALGAGRMRLIRQLLTESVLLAVISGAVAILLSLWGSRLLWLAVEQFVAMHSTFVSQIRPDTRVFFYTLLLSLFTGALFGLSPALTISCPAVRNPLKDSSAVLGRAADHSRLRGLLVGGQIAISTMFLMIAGLLARGTVRSHSTDPGFEVRTVYPLPLPSSADPAKDNILRQQIFERLQALPEVQNLALTDYVPLRDTWTTQVAIDTQSASGSSTSSTLLTFARHVSSTFFNALGIPILRGRTFTREEYQSGAGSALVSAAMARQAWHGADPLGKKIKLEISRHEWSVFQVVGVIGDVRSASISRVDPAVVYLPATEAHLRDYAALVRISGDPGKAISVIRSILEQSDGMLRPGFSLTSLQDGAVQPQIVMAKTFTLSATFLGLSALVLALIGVYGVTAFLVSQRTKEVGVHVAVGATQGDVLARMLREGMRPVVVGLAFGLVGALGISGLLRALLIFPGSVDILYGGHWFDPAVFLGLASLLTAVALLACYVPALRATRIDPVTALRHE